jgi:acyl-CoA synthetase (AMP-forming)/AMP-acid ligase II/ankyrin repeat protein
MTTTTNTQHHAWINRPAILWDAKMVPTNNGCYWKHLDWLGAETTEEGLSMISYKSLLTIASLVVADLREQLQKEIVVVGHGNENGNGIGIPIAVAIPEGPWLPLAVLVVHALNYNANKDKDDDSSAITNANSNFAILVPLEPSEAKERNLHILQEVRPAKILAIPGTDMEQLRELVVLLLDDEEEGEKRSSVSGVGSSDDGGRPFLARSASCELVDFTGLVQNAVQTRKKSNPPILLDRILDDWVLENNGRLDVDVDGLTLQELVAAVVAQVGLLDAECGREDHPLEQLPEKRRRLLQQPLPPSASSMDPPRISHIVYTSGTTGKPKGCISSLQSLQHYLHVKNDVYGIRVGRQNNDNDDDDDHATVPVVLLASALSFDPCLSDILATFTVQATLAVAPRARLLGHLSTLLQPTSLLGVTHVLCTPTLWSMVLLDGAQPHDFPDLRVVALGGEPIPKRVRQIWARRRRPNNHTNTNHQDPTEDDDDNDDDTTCRLFATYGVTEACVYQTCGEIFVQEEQDNGGDGGGVLGGQLVGPPFRGMGVRICQEQVQDSLVDVPPGEAGELIVYGAQLDTVTGYLNRPELRHKFVAEVVRSSSTTSTSTSTSDEEDHAASQRLTYHYRTGDRGCVDPDNGALRILGRIVGEEGMVKINGVRVELGEIESALVDDLDFTADTDSDSAPVVISCLAKVLQREDRSEIHAYCVLSDAALKELGITSKDNLPKPGMLIRGGAILPLLRARCVQKVKTACLPTAFVIIPSLPLSPTGKRDRKGLPDISECVPLDHHGDYQTGVVLLKEYGAAGSLLAEQIIDCLNLQPSQEVMLTTAVTFGMLGGDSLSATRVTRALYAHHLQIDNTRYLGGAFGKLEGPFDVIHLLRAKTLGDYVDMLDQRKIGARQNNGENGGAQEISPSSSTDSQQQVPSEEPSTISSQEDNGQQQQQQALYDALLQAATLGQSIIAMGLLQVGANPDYGMHRGRLSKVTTRLEQKVIFRSSPLHLACLKGDDALVKQLLERHAKLNSPDAAGLYPLHLAASDVDDGSSSSSSAKEEETTRRSKCVQYLLEAGTPVTMRDGNKQSVLHAAARAGHVEILRTVMTEWNDKDDERNTNGQDDYSTTTTQRQRAKHFFNWMDRWFRTAVHWAVLNGRVEALSVLLELGCNPCPPKPKVNKRSSAAIESPLELCDRLYTSSSSSSADIHNKGAAIRRLLSSHEHKS